MKTSKHASMYEAGWVERGQAYRVRITDPESVDGVGGQEFLGRDVVEDRVALLGEAVAGKQLDEVVRAQVRQLHTLLRLEHLEHLRHRRRLVRPLRQQQHRCVSKIRKRRKKQRENLPNCHDDADVAIIMYICYYCFQSNSTEAVSWFIHALIG